MKEAVLVAGVRTPVGKATKGSLRNVRPEDLGAFVIRELLKRTPQVEKELVEDVIIGCAFPEGEQGMNLARLIALLAGLPTSTAGITINRFCSSGLQAIAYAAQQIMIGQAECLVAGGVESMSRVPMGGHTVSPHPWLVQHLPQSYMSMGQTAEEVAKRYGISREEQDQFAVRSHQLAAQAIREGKFQAELVPVPVKETFLGEKGDLQYKEFYFQEDEGVRPQTNMQILSKLKPVFHPQGSVTAGNASPTSDGAAAVLVMEAKKAESLGLKPLLAFRSFAVGGVDPEVMGIGPVAAVPKALAVAGIRLEEVDLIELNEAFASQVLQVMRSLELPKEKVNVNGGAIALGHPLGCSGTKLTINLLNELVRRKQRYGLVTMCIGGGMGAAAVFERLS